MIRGYFNFIVHNPTTVANFIQNVCFTKLISQKLAFAPYNIQGDIGVVKFPINAVII